MDAGKETNPPGLSPLAPFAPFPPPRQDNRSPAFHMRSSFEWMDRRVACLRIREGQSGTDYALNTAGAS
jgi:hypothetical protein